MGLQVRRMDKITNFKTEMKKILCLIDTLGSGGAERQMVGLAVLLKNKGYNVDLVSYHKEDLYAPIARIGGVEPIVLKVENSPFSKFNAIRRFIKQHGKYDCVITYKGGPNIIGCLLKMLGLKSRLIVSERNTTQELTRHERKKFWMYRFADFIVPNAYSQSEFISVRYPALKKKIATITNFTDSKHFSPKPNKKKSERINILTTARIAKQKNLINYLRAIALLKQRDIKDVHFDWYGDLQKVAGRYGEEVKHKVEELSIQEMISFYPNVANIVERYQDCDIFCLPSLYEGFPNAICEAMSCGKPIVCSRICDNPRIVSEGQNGIFFDPKNIEDIADKLYQMINMSQQQREQWGEKSRELAIEMFSEEAFVQKYIQLIEQ